MLKKPIVGNNMGITLRIRYKFALSIIASLVLFSQIMIQTALNNEKSDARVINIAGRQRMLSQRITKVALGLYLSSEEQTKVSYLNELAYSVDLWEKSHKALQFGDTSLGTPGKNSATISSMFKNIEENHQEILSSAKKIIVLANEETIQRDKIYREVQRIVSNESLFLEGMDDIVFQYDSESKKKTDFIRNFEISILFATFLLLGLEVIYIFKPAENHINKAFQHIKENQDNFLKLFEAAPIPMLLVDENNLDVIKLNGLAENMLSLCQASFGNLNLKDIIVNSEESTISIIERIKTLNKISNEDTIINLFDNRSLNSLISSSKLTFFEKDAILIGFSDITKLKKAEELLNHYATFDEMTQLFNKRSGMIILETAFEKILGTDKNLSICFIDIDGLKYVNDTYGHNEGDCYIKFISRAILKSLSTRDYAFRFGGDEIIILLEDCDLNNTKKIIKRIEQNIADSKVSFNKPYEIGFSYGIADIKSNSVSNIEDLIKCADEKMYQNKNSKKKL